jgi:hypothetical protein
MRRHLNYANVAATLALVFAMSGGALAAGHYLINSPKQINPKVLRKLRGRTGRTGPRGPQGPAGPRGATGPQGPGGGQGPTGATGANGTEGKEGPPGQVRASATIEPAKKAGELGKLRAGAHGIERALQLSTSETCVFLVPSIKANETAPVASSHLGDVTLTAAGGACSEGLTEGVLVKEFKGEGEGANEIFSLVVP